MKNESGMNLHLFLFLGENTKGFFRVKIFADCQKSAIEKFYYNFTNCEYYAITLIEKQ